MSTFRPKDTFIILSHMHTLFQLYIRNVKIASSFVTIIYPFARLLYLTARIISNFNLVSSKKPEKMNKNFYVELNNRIELS